MYPLYGEVKADVRYLFQVVSVAEHLGPASFSIKLWSWVIGIYRAGARTVSPTTEISNECHPIKREESRRDTSRSWIEQKSRLDRNHMSTRVSAPGSAWKARLYSASSAFVHALYPSLSHFNWETCLPERAQVNFFIYSVMCLLLFHV